MQSDTYFPLQSEASVVLVSSCAGLPVSVLRHLCRRDLAGDAAGVRESHRSSEDELSAFGQKSLEVHGPTCIPASWHMLHMPLHDQHGTLNANCLSLQNKSVAQVVVWISEVGKPAKHLRLRLVDEHLRAVAPGIHGDPQPAAGCVWQML